MAAILRRVTYRNPTKCGSMGAIYTLLHPTVPPNRQMTTSKRVKDRSKKKRIHDLEVVTEKWKIFSKTHFLMELLRSEPEHIMPLRLLDKYRREISLPKPHKLSDFIKKSPNLFELYKDRRGTTWVGLTDQGEELADEEETLIEANSDKAAEYVTRFLMMSIDKRLRVDKIAHFRRDIGLPLDFKDNWIHRYPDLFKLVKGESEEIEYLELVGWKKEWAVTELEKKVGAVRSGEDGNEMFSHHPGVLSLAFPMKYPSDYKRVSMYRDKIENFQVREYLSPYADGRELVAGSLEFDKRAVAIMHEVLSFTWEKRLVTDHLTHFRREFVMPQKLMRLLLKHIGIFYVSERGKRFHVFLNEAYEGAELIEKCPLVLWKEKFHSLNGYRQKNKRVESSTEMSDTVNKEMLQIDSEGEEYIMEHQDGETMTNLEDGLLLDEADMDVTEISDAYQQS